MKLRHLSEEHKNKIRKSLKGHLVTEATRLKLSKANAGQIPWILGKHLSKETRQRMSNLMKGRFIGRNNPRYNPNDIRNHYNKEFTNIRNTVKQQCEICSSIKSLCIHHIDKNYSNNELSNVMIVCRGCHNRIHLPRKKRGLVE